MRSLLIIPLLLGISSPAIANNSQDAVEKQYQIYWEKCSNTSSWQSNPQKARDYCNKAIEVDPNNSNISDPYLFKSIITIMFTDEFKTNKSKIIFESTYKDLTKVIENTDSLVRNSSFFI